MAPETSALIVLTVMMLAPSPARPASATQGQAPAKPASATQGQAPAKPASATQGQAPAKPASAPPAKLAEAPLPQPPAKPVAPQGQAAPAAPAPPPAPQAAPPPQEAYTYRPEGRRDPFLNLVGTGTDAKLTSRRGEGPPGLTVAEITVRGIMQSRGGFVAMIQGPDNKTYIVHQGDKLLDGTIKSITAQGLVVAQEVNDPLSLIKQREVRKLLRSLEDAKK